MRDWCKLAISDSSAFAAALLNDFGVRIHGRRPTSSVTETGSLVDVDERRDATRAVPLKGEFANSSRSLAMSKMGPNELRLQHPTT